MILKNAYLSVPREREVIIINKIGKKFQKIYPTDYNLMMAQHLWQAHYQIMLIILLKKFIELNVNMDTIIKNVKLAELNTKTASAFLDTKTLMII